MGSITYDFLSESLFLNKQTLKTGFEHESDSRIEKELIDYRNFITSRQEDLRKEITENVSSLNVFSTTDLTSINLLKQTALYLNQFVISDPLFRFSNLETENERAMSKQLGFEKKGINRTNLMQASKYLKEITPMVAGNFVKIFPVSYYFEPPKNLPINLPKDYYNDILPKEVLSFFHKHSRVSPMHRSEGGGWSIHDHEELVPGRAISVEFEGTGFRGGAIYFLSELEILSADSETGIVNFRQSLPDTIPDQEHFEAWVRQSINSAAKAYFDKTHGEIFISSNLQSTYICDNQFSNDLISKNFASSDSIETFTTNQLLNIELPFLDNIDTVKLMKIREDDAETFTSFRIELERQFRELRTISDKNQLKLKAENIFHELNIVQGDKIKKKITLLKKQMLLNTALAIGGLVASAPTGGISLLSTAIALGKGYKDYNDYLDKATDNPGYFLWESRR